MEIIGSHCKFRTEPQKTRIKLALLGTLPTYNEELKTVRKMENRMKSVTLGRLSCDPLRKTMLGICVEN